MVMKQNKHQLDHLPTLLIQQIRLQWYKDCRGGNAAAQRNQYPRAMRLPKDFFSYYPFGLPTHFVSILQKPDGFQIDKDCRRPVSYTHLSRSSSPSSSKRSLNKVRTEDGSSSPEKNSDGDISK